MREVGERYEGDVEDAAQVSMEVVDEEVDGDIDQNDPQSYCVSEELHEDVILCVPLDERVSSWTASLEGPSMYPDQLPWNLEGPAIPSAVWNIRFAVVSAGWKTMLGLEPRPISVEENCATFPQAGSSTAFARCANELANAFLCAFNSSTEEFRCRSSHLRPFSGSLGPIGRYDIDAEGKEGVGYPVDGRIGGWDA